jgi:hypothetical protein
MPVPGPGTLVFMTVDDVEVATLTFSKPAFGPAVDGQAVGRVLVNAWAMSAFGGKADIGLRRFNVRF